MNFIKIYEFEFAPKYLQNLSNNGGDEDWIAVVPKKIYDRHCWIGFLESDSFSAGCDQQIIIGKKYVIYIGSHA